MICKRSSNNIYRRMFTLDQLGIKEEQIVVLAITDRNPKMMLMEGIVRLINKKKEIYLDGLTVVLYPKDTAFSVGWKRLETTTYYDWLYWNVDEWGKDGYKG